MKIPRWHAATLAISLACVPASIPGQALGEPGVHVGLVPAHQTVAPGSEFTIAIQVTEAGSPFNAYDAVIGYDPGALTLVPTSPLSLQEGAYMKNVCGSTFHLFDAAADSASITEVLLCAGQSLTGPGQVYQLKFRASATPQATWIRLRHAQFYNAGYYDDSSRTADAVVGIGIELDVPAPAGMDLGLRAIPNPSAGQVQLALRLSGAEPWRLDVLDLAGRRVRAIARGVDAGAARTAIWDGRDEGGRRVPDGVYLVILGAGAHRACARVTMIH